MTKEKQFQEGLMQLLENYYKQALSEAIKKGIRAKKRKMLSTDIVKKSKV